MAPQGQSCERCARAGAICVTKSANPDSSRVSVPHNPPRNPSHSPTQASSIHFNSSGAGTTAVSPPPSTEQQTVASIHVQDLCSQQRPTPRSSLDYSFTSFDFSDAPSTAPPDPLQQQHVEGKDTGTVGTLSSSIFDDMADFTDADAVLPFLPETPHSSLNTPPPTVPLRDLLELSTKLVQDYEMLRTEEICSRSIECSHSMERVIQFALGGTSRLCDILDSIAVADVGGTRTYNRTGSISTGPIESRLAQFSEHDSASRVEGLETSNYTEHCPYGATAPSGSAPRNMTRLSRLRSHDLLLTTTLVTTYILLVRIWRRTFSRLNGHLPSNSSLANAAAHGCLLGLPSLQFGGFHVRNNPTIQILVILELASSMLQKIERYMGVSKTAGYGSRCSSLENDARHGECCIDTEPVFVSIRDTLLSQEMLRVSVEDEPGELSLQETMEKVKKHLAQPQC